jgi:hypothetical protein
MAAPAACVLPRALAEQLLAALSPQLAGSGSDARGAAVGGGAAPPFGAGFGDDGAASAAAAVPALARIESGSGAPACGAPPAQQTRCRAPAAQLFLSYRVPETGARGDRSIFSLRAELEACGYRHAPTARRARAAAARLRGAHTPHCAPRKTAPFFLF